MKKITRLSSAGSRLVGEALGGKLMLSFVIASGIYYALLLVSNVLGGEGLGLGLVMILAQGFVTAESVMLYQRKESRNLKQLSVFCLIAMIALFLLCAFLGSVVATLIGMESGPQTEEVAALLAEADLSAELPYMIATVVSVGLSGLAMLFLWKALAMSAGLMEHRGELKNWFLPAAVTLALGAALALAYTALQPGNALNVAVTLASVVRDGLLAALLARASAQCRAELAG